MSLKLVVSDEKLKAMLAKIDADKRITPVEFSELRKYVDDLASGSVTIHVRDSMRVLCNACDILADIMKILYLELLARDCLVPNKDLAQNAKQRAEMNALFQAVQGQLIYVIKSYDFTLGKGEAALQTPKP